MSCQKVLTNTVVLNDLHQIYSIFPYFLDTSGGHIIRPNFNALKGGAFSVVGKMLATMIVQGGELPRIFSPSMCQYIQRGFDSANPGIDEVPDGNIQKSLKQVIIRALYSNTPSYTLALFLYRASKKRNTNSADCRTLHVEFMVTILTILT